MLVDQLSLEAFRRRVERGVLQNGNRGVPRTLQSFPRARTRLLTYLKGYNRDCEHEHFALLWLERYSRRDQTPAVQAGW